jgi:hypothetical protein
MFHPGFHLRSLGYRLVVTRSVYNMEVIGGAWGRDRGGHAPRIMLHLLHATSMHTGIGIA